MILLHAKPRSFFLMHLCTYEDRRLLAHSAANNTTRMIFGGVEVAQPPHYRSEIPKDVIIRQCARLLGQSGPAGPAREVLHARHGCLVLSILYLSPLDCWYVWSVATGIPHAIKIIPETVWERRKLTSRGHSLSDDRHGSFDGTTTNRGCECEKRLNTRGSSSTGEALRADSGSAIAVETMVHLINTFHSN